MTFKTDTIKLKLLTSDADADEVDGELAVVNDVLRLRTGGTWADVSSGGGGGGLTNVADDTTPELGGNLTVPAGTTINFENNTITDTKIGFWDTAYSSILSLGTAAGTALEGDTPTISVDQATKVDFLTVNDAVDLDDVKTKALEAHSWGNHADANYGFSDVYQLSDLVDVDTPNTASLGAQHEGKILGVVLGSPAVASSFSIDLSAVDETNGIISYFKFTIDGSDYEVNIETANQALASDTAFINGNVSVGVGGVRINGTNDSDTIAADIRTVFTDAVTTYWGNAYTISGTGSQAVITANVAGSASSILYNPNVSTLAENFNITSVLGTNAFYQYELVNASGAADPNWNHVQNTAWTEDIEIEANTASNLTWINTQNPGANELTIRQPSDYGAYAVITVMNASNSTMDISTVDNSFDFNCQQLTPTQVNTISLSIFQKAILVRTSGTDWEVVLASI